MNNECNLNTLTGAEILQLIDSGKFINAISKYGFVSIPAVIGANSIKNTNDGKR